jgi:hypothetical protein
MKITIVLVLTAVTLVAGPPLICNPVEIRDAKSLPWKEVSGWNGADRSYNVESLATDTLAILTPGAALPLRMETLRCAAIYASRNEAAAGQLTSRLLARVADADAAGEPLANSWFDAGYFAEALRQAYYVRAYDKSGPSERTQWQSRIDTTPDGRTWIEKAIRMGGQGMGPALADSAGYH